MKTPDNDKKLAKFSTFTAYPLEAFLCYCFLFKHAQVMASATKRSLWRGHDIDCNDIRVS